MPRPRYSCKDADFDVSSITLQPYSGASHSGILPFRLHTKRFDTTGSSRYAAGSEVHFTPEQEARLSKIATKEGVDPEELVKDAALRLLEDDTRFRSGVQKGIGQADRGEFVEEEEMDARVKRLFRS